ncbi:sulfur carrier protein ThiS [Hominifimenecus sp. rT4P-3]|uniref:sulfur carrier protein ThiS n=1 Tax=Hominifimenecus sp. rT4P-3 TaxID=3242979 RepID=UPI003DA43EC0
MITVNGIEDSEGEGKLLVEYLQEHGYDPARIAVERNGSILPRSQYGRTWLEVGDVLEIVHFVGGG